MLDLEFLELRRNYIKSIYLYKIRNDIGTPNFKQLFRQFHEGESSKEIGNRETDLKLPKPKKEFYSLNNNDLSIGIISLPKPKQSILSIH